MDELTKKGSLRLHWAYEHMPVLQEVDKRFRKEQPLAGLKIGMALHTEAKTITEGDSVVEAPTHNDTRLRAED